MMMWNNTQSQLSIMSRTSAVSPSCCWRHTVQRCVRPNTRAGSRVTVSHSFTRTDSIACPPCASSSVANSMRT